MARILEIAKEQAVQNIERRLGIVGKTIRARREKREEEQRIQEQLQEINDRSRVIASHRVRLTSIEAGFIQIAKNLQLVNKWADAQVTTEQETRLAIEEQRKKQEALREKPLPKEKEEDTSDFFKKLKKIRDLLDDIRRKKLKKPKRGPRRKKPKRPKTRRKKPTRPKTRGKKFGRLKGFGRFAKIGGRVLGAVGLAAGAYEASEFLRETRYGERMKAGEGKKAEAAFKQMNVVYGDQKLTPQQAQDILDSKNERDIKAFGGRAALEATAAKAKAPVAVSMPKVAENKNVPPPGWTPAEPAPATKARQQTVETIPMPWEPPITVLPEPPETGSAVSRAPLPKPAATATPPAPAVGEPEAKKPPPSLSSVTTIAPDVTVAGMNNTLVQRVAAMAADFQEKTGKKLMLTSGVRTNEHQKRLWDAKVAELGGNTAAARKWVAEPMPPLGGGRGSPHMLGLAVDINSKGPNGINRLAGTRDIPSGWLEDFGLTRNVPGEDWHVQLAKTAPVSDGATVVSKTGTPIDPGTGAVKNVPTNPQTGQSLLDTSKTVADMRRENQRPREATIVVRKTNTNTVYDQKKQPLAQSAAAVGA